MGTIKIINKFFGLNIKVKLLLSYVFIVAFSIGLISIFMNFFIDEFFKEYVKENQEIKNREIVSSIGKSFELQDSFVFDSIESIGTRALEIGKIIKVYNGSGDLIWDATNHNNGMCRKIIEQMSKSMNKNFPSINGEYMEVPYDVIVNSKKIGEVKIGTYGPFYLSDNDIYFIKMLNRILIIIVFVSITAAVIIGNSMAGGISKPIRKVTGAVKRISEGAYDERIKEENKTLEIMQLTKSINNLAKTLQEQEKLRKRLSADVAHELRTPLATLQSHMEAMIDGVWKADKERLTSCHAEILRIKGLVENLEKLAYYEKELLVLNFGEFNLQDIVRDTIKKFAVNNIDGNKNINFQVSGDRGKIYADSEKIVQVLINVIANSIKYSDANVEIMIGIKDSSKYIELTVEDNGYGIPEADIKHVFERFYRVDQSRNRQSGGSGIGLAIVKAIIEAHKGQVDIESKLGVGTKIIIRFHNHLC